MVVDLEPLFLGQRAAGDAKIVYLAEVILVLGDVQLEAEGVVRLGRRFQRVAIDDMVLAVFQQVFLERINSVSSPKDRD